MGCLPFSFYRRHRPKAPASDQAGALASGWRRTRSEAPYPDIPSHETAEPAWPAAGSPPAAVGDSADPLEVEDQLPGPIPLVAVGRPGGRWRRVPDRTKSTAHQARPVPEVAAAAGVGRRPMPASVPARRGRLRNRRDSSCLPCCRSVPERIAVGGVLPFILTQGTFHLVGRTQAGTLTGFQPDSDSIPIQARQPPAAGWARPTRPAVRLTRIGSTQLRLEGIDALELHSHSTTSAGPSGTQVEAHPRLGQPVWPAALAHRAALAGADAGSDHPRPTASASARWASSSSMIRRTSS
jgi:hypothetical protein